MSDQSEWSEPNCTAGDYTSQFRPLLLTTSVASRAIRRLCQENNFHATFYCAMHYSAKCGLAIACHLSVCLSVCDVGGSGPYRLKILETHCANN